MHRILTNIYECIEKKTIVEYNKMQKCTGICICNAGRYVKLFIHKYKYMIYYQFTQARSSLTSVFIANIRIPCVFNGIYNHLFKNGEQYSNWIIEISYLQSIKLRLQDFMNGSSQGRIQEYSKVYELLTLAKRAIFSLATLCKCWRPFKSARTPFCTLSLES